MRYEFTKSLELAHNLFESDYECRCQVFCFIWYKGKLIQYAKNNAKTHTLNLRNGNGIRAENKGSCAEFLAFKSLKNRTNIPFNKVTVVNVRLDRNKQIKMSAPCIFCTNLIKYLNVKDLHFTNTLGKFEKYLTV